MNIAEMHVYFRQYAQQMGMQNVRAIIPEQIDILLNTAISDIINQLVKENVGIRNDRAIVDTSKIGQINALRSLYVSEDYDMYSDSRFMDFNANDATTGRMSNKDDINHNLLSDYLYLVNFAIKYKVGDIGYSGNHLNKGSAISSSELHRKETNYFPVRFIEESRLAETLNDPILKNKFYSPIIVMTNDNVLELYIDTFKQNDVNRYFLIDNYIPYKLRVSYIKKPAKVLYGEDVNLTNVDCDLPESLHVDIVKHATDLYRMAVLGGRYNNQQNQQEIARPNNGR